MIARSIITRDSDPAGLIARFTMPPAFYKRVNETRFKQEWRLTHFQYLCLKLGWDGEGDPQQWMMRAFKGPRFQRGMLSGMGVRRAFQGAAGGSVGISAHSVTDSRFTNGTSTSNFQFQTDGELWSLRANQSDTQYTGEWWSDEPETAVGDDYEARHLSSGKTGTYSTEAAVANTWITMTAHRTWGVSQTGQGTKTCTATFELGDDGAESSDDSAVLTCAAEVDFS